MYVRYGSYNHDAGEVELSVTKDPMYTGAQTIWAHQWRIEMRGQLVGSSEADLDTKQAALEAAYASNGEDWALVLTSTSDSNLAIANASTLGGVRVVGGIHYQDMRSAAYVTYLPYQITLEAIVPLSSSSLDTGLFSFEETVTKEGGGPRYGVLEPVVGRPVRQLLKRQTIYRARQTGRAVGINARPLPPSPLWPEWMVQAPVVERGHPVRIGGGTETSYNQYPVAWDYSFEAPVPLVGNGNIWGLTYGN